MWLQTLHWFGVVLFVWCLPGFVLMLTAEIETQGELRWWHWASAMAGILICGPYIAWQLIKAWLQGGDGPG